MDTAGGEHYDGPPEEGGVLFGRFVDIALEAHARGHFDAAYHGLAAALHLARAAEDEPAMLRVERLAEEQLGHIDRTAPGYHHSTPESHRRGQSVSIFATLARQAHVAASVVRSQRSAARARLP